MYKTTIFIFQSSVVFDLFVVEVVKRHFHLNFVTSLWVQAIIGFHLMKLALCYGVVCGKSQQSDYIDWSTERSAWQYAQVLASWKHGNRQYGPWPDKSTTICVAVKPFLPDWYGRFSVNNWSTTKIFSKGDSNLSSIDGRVTHELSWGRQLSCMQVISSQSLFQHSFTITPSQPAAMRRN